MHLKKISVLMPVYNAELYLREAIDSILQQTFTDFEFIIINDGSTDNSHKIVQSYTDQRIKYYQNDQNRGIVYTLNRGIDLAQAPYIARMDADDISLPERLAKQFAFLEKNNDVLLVATLIEPIDKTGNKTKQYWTDDVNNITSEQIFYKLHFGNCLAHPSVLFRKDIVKQIGGYNKTHIHAEDYGLWLKLAYIGKFAKLNEYLLLWRSHEASITKTNYYEAVSPLSTTHRIAFDKLQQIIQRAPNLYEQSILQQTYYTFPLRKLWRVYIAFQNINAAIVAHSPSFLDKNSIKTLADYQQQTLRKFIFQRLAQNRYIKMLVSPLRKIQSARYNFIKQRKEKQHQTFVKQEAKKLTNSFARNNNRCVLFLFPNFTSGGASKVFLDIASGIDKHKTQSIVIATFASDNTWKNRFEQSFDHVFDLSVYPYPVYLVFELVKQIHPNVVLVSNTTAGYDCIPLIKQYMPSITIIDLMHAEGGDLENVSLPYVPYIDHRIVISQHLKNFLTNQYAQNSVPDTYIQRFTVIYNGVDIHQYSPCKASGIIKKKLNLAESTLLVGYLGRLSPEKDLTKIIQAANIIKQQQADMHFVLIGEGAERTLLEKMIAEYNVESYVTLFGYTNDINSAISDCDVFVLTSQREGLPLAIIEPMAMEKSVVAANVGAICEIIDDGENGFLLTRDAYFSEKLAEKLLFLQQNRIILQQMGIKAREKITRVFSLQTMHDKYNTMFNL